MTPGNGAKRILVVDDEPSIVDAVATSLRYEGFDVGEATTGRGALDSAKERLPDLIVLDIMLPDFDGLEVTRRLRSFGSASAGRSTPRNRGACPCPAAAAEPPRISTLTSGSARTAG